MPWRLLKDISTSGDHELYKTVEDIKAMSYLGKYYAHKINAATNLGLFKNKSTPDFHNATIKELNTSALYWRYYAATALARYKNPLWTNRVGYVNWIDLYDYVLKDITDQHGKVELPHMETTRGGTILEAETATQKNTKELSEVQGFTGSGYVAATGPNTKLTLTYNAPVGGKYILEFRYIVKDGEERFASKTSVFVEELPSTEITFWQNGSSRNWVWDKVEVNLSKGKQGISFILPEKVLLDHVNVLSR